MKLEKKNRRLRLSGFPVQINLINNLPICEALLRYLRRASLFVFGCFDPFSCSEAYLNGLTRASLKLEKKIRKLREGKSKNLRILGPDQQNISTVSGKHQHSLPVSDGEIDGAGKEVGEIGGHEDMHGEAAVSVITVRWGIDHGSH